MRLSIYCSIGPFLFWTQSAASKRLLRDPKNSDNAGVATCGPLEPTLPGVMPSSERPHIILAQDIDFPPYATLGPPEEGLPLAGFSYDFATGLPEVCDVNITMTQTSWGLCWGDNVIGDGLDSGYYHGCTSYSHTTGVRTRYLEFSDPILNDRSAAGLLTRLENGKPVVDGLSDLNGVTVVDIVGYAPSPDALAIVSNRCTGSKFSGYNVISPIYGDAYDPDSALRTLLDGGADAMWVCEYDSL